MTKKYPQSRTLTKILSEKIIPVLFIIMYLLCLYLQHNSRAGDHVLGWMGEFENTKIFPNANGSVEQ